MIWIIIVKKEAGENLFSCKVYACVSKVWIMMQEVRITGPAMCNFLSALVCKCSAPFPYIIGFSRVLRSWSQESFFSYQIGYYYVRLKGFYHGCTCSVTKGEVQGPPLTILERTSLHFARKMRAKSRKTRDWIETEAGMGFLGKWQGGKKLGPYRELIQGGTWGRWWIMSVFSGSVALYVLATLIC